MDFIERKRRSKRTWRQRLKAPPVPRKEANSEGYLMASAR